jgi:hypothetical protein
MKKSYGSGVFTGIVATLGLAAAAIAAVKKTVIDPLDEQDKKVEESRKKALRKRVTR